MFRFEAKSKNLVEGDPLVLECKAKGYPLPTASWLKNDLPIDTSDPRVSFSEYEGVENATLRIENLNYSDRADYTCVATNDDGVSANATILVRVKSKYSPDLHIVKVDAFRVMNAFTVTMKDMICFAR